MALEEVEMGPAGAVRALVEVAMALAGMGKVEVGVVRALEESEMGTVGAVRVQVEVAMALVEVGKE